MATALANWLVGTGFASRYPLHHRVGFKGPMGRGKATTPSSLSLTSNRVTTNDMFQTDSPVGITACSEGAR